MATTNNDNDEPEYNLYKDARRLARAVDGIGEKKARRILEQTGGIVGMYRYSRGEMESLDGVGPATVETIGLWDEKGTRVHDLPDNPCPECGEEFDENAGRTLLPEELDGAVRVCSSSAYSSRSVSHYIHRAEVSE